MKSNEIITESKIVSILKDVVSSFNNEVSDPKSTGPLDWKGPSSRVWTRGDGTRHRDPAKIFLARDWATRKDEEAARKKSLGFWDWLKSQPGAKPVGTVSGEFTSDKHREAIKYLGYIWVDRGDGIRPYVEVMSPSRVRNPNSVWHHKP